MNTPQRTSAADAFLDMLLEEGLRDPRPDTAHEAPPPGATRSDADRTPKRALMTTILVGAIAAIVAVVWWTRGSDDRARRGPATDQDKGRPAPTSNRWQPKSAQELQAELPKLRSVLVRLNTVAGMKVKAADFPFGPLVSILEEGAELDALRRSIRNALRRPVAGPLPGVESGADSDAVLQGELDGDRHFLVALVPGKEPVLLVPGLGRFALEPAATTLVARRCFLRSVDAETATALGLAHPRHLSLLATGVEHLRLHDFDPQSLPTLAKFNAVKSLDLRYSKAVHDAPSLRVLRQLLPDLRVLRLCGDNLDRDGLTELSRFARLAELQVLAIEGSYWGVPGNTSDARRIDDDAVASLLSLKHLEVLVMPQSSMTDSGVARLAEFKKLRQLVLSGSARVSGSGFAAFADHSTLTQLHLNGCQALTDVGLRAIAAIPHLSQLFLRQVRSVARPNRGPGAEGLSALRSARRLHRLELGGWFDRGPVGDVGEQRKASTLTAAWRKALADVCALPELAWLALDQCPDLVLSDLECLARSAVQTLNLANTVGQPPCRIHPDQLDKVFALPANLQTIIHQ